MNNTFSFLKEASGGATVIENGHDRYFVNTPANFVGRGNTIILNIGGYEYKISLSDSITIDTGTGAALFAGTIAQLKAALKLVFPKAGAAATTTGSNLLPINSRKVDFGDSQTANGVNVGANQLAYSNFGYTTFANLLSGYSFYTPVNGNKGVSGQQTADMIARLGAATALNPNVVQVLASTNDIAAGVTTQVIITNLERIYNAFLAIGAKVIAITVLPRFGASVLSTAYETNRQTVNTWIKSKASSEIIVVDAEATMNNSTLFYDGLHPTSYGAFLLGSLVATVLKTLIKTTGKVVHVLSADNTYNPNLYFTGTGGTKANGATGTVVSGFALDGANTGAAVVGSIVTANGFNAQQIAITGSYTGNAKTISLNCNPTGALPAIGDTIEALSEFEIVTNDPNVLGVSIGAVVWNADYSITPAILNSLQNGDQLSNPLTAGVRYIDRTPAFALTAANGGNAQVGFSILLKNASAATPINFAIKLHKIGMRKIPVTL